MFALVSVMGCRIERKSLRRRAYCAAIESLEDRYLLNADLVVAVQVPTALPSPVHADVPSVRTPITPVLAGTANHETGVKGLPAMMFSNTGRANSNQLLGGLSSSPDDDVREKMESTMPFENQDGTERSENGLLDGDDLLLDTNSDDIELMTAVAPHAATLSSLLDAGGVDHLLENEATTFPTFEGGVITTSSKVHVISDPYFETLEVAQR